MRRLLSFSPLSFTVSFTNKLHKCDRDACLKFMDLWKKKHETGQWVEIEAAEVMASQANISAANDSGIVFANGGKIIREWFMSHNR